MFRRRISLHGTIHRMLDAIGRAGSRTIRTLTRGFFAVIIASDNDYCYGYSGDKLFHAGRLLRKVILLLPEKQSYRYPLKIEMFSQLVLQVIPVRLFHIIGEVAKESK